MKGRKMRIVIGLLCVFAFVGCKKQKPAEQASPVYVQEAVDEPVREPEERVTENGAPGASERPEPPKSLEEPEQETTATAGSAGPGASLQVQPLKNRTVLELTADDVVQVMRAAGFSDTQIFEHGTAVRDGLAGLGAVQIKSGGTVEAVVAAYGDSVYISTRTRGHFIYNVKTGLGEAPASR